MGMGKGKTLQVKTKEGEPECRMQNAECWMMNDEAVSFHNEHPFQVTSPVYVNSFF